jgi:thioesterase domain-containing protein/acyl carrier protein
MSIEAYGVKPSVKRETASAATETLVSIWQRVLRIPAVDVHDDFFDLGGDSSLALLLFAEIGQAFGRELPPVTIYQARTVAALAALLEQPTAPRFPALVQLREGNGRQSIFFVHGLGGSAMDFFQPVRYIASEHAIYGLQARGSDGLDEPLQTIEAMAEYSIGAIRELQPRGPYVLIGYSLGGLVALEMAQRLRAGGEKIGLLAMLDAYPHMSQLPFGQRMRLLARQGKRGLRSLRELTAGAGYKAPNEVVLTPAMQRVRDAAYKALTRYRPRFYEGRVQFVRAQVVTAFPKNAGAVWKPFMREIEVETAPGDHLGIIANHYEELAAVLSRHLRKAFTETA